MSNWRNAPGQGRRIPLPKRKVDREFERFMSHVKILDSGCWEWTGCTNKRSGYGNFRFNGTTVLAHRFSYVLHIGDIPQELELDHLCRNRRCVNPKHLEPVTGRDNCLRGESFSAHNFRKEVCPNGHPLQDGNLIKDRFRKRGHRICRECVLIQNKKRREMYRKNGMCTACGKRPHVPGKSMCADCQEYFRTWARRKYAAA